MAEVEEGCRKSAIGNYGRVGIHGLSAQVVDPIAPDEDMDLGEKMTSSVSRFGLAVRR